MWEPFLLNPGACGLGIHGHTTASGRLGGIHGHTTVEDMGWGRGIMTVFGEDHSISTTR